MTTRKNKVDWFPHQCHHGMTIFVLEQKYGMHGYYFWFHLLELLGSTEGHFIDYLNTPRRAHLEAYTRTSPEQCWEMLILLANLQAIDLELWEQSHIIWSENFLKGIAPAYRNRRITPPEKPAVILRENIKLPVDYKFFSKKEGRKEEVITNVITSPSSPPGDGVLVKKKEVLKEEGPKEENPHSTLAFEQFWKAYPRKVGKADARKAWEVLRKSKKLPGILKLLRSIEAQKGTDQWLKDGGQFIPHPATWLRGGRWDDEFDSLTDGTPGPRRHRKLPDPNCPLCKQTPGWVEVAGKGGRKAMKECDCTKVKELDDIPL
jgi:hypothetical protein